jgi:hypothetical protein
MYLEYRRRRQRSLDVATHVEVAKEVVDVQKEVAVGNLSSDDVMLLIVVRNSQKI